MGMFYCHGCETYQDSRVALYIEKGGKGYCEECLPEDEALFQVVTNEEHAEAALTKGAIHE